MGSDMKNKFTVFAVDDDPFVLDIIRGILAADYAVETFTSVAECQRRLEAQKPDMFLLDVRMPGMDGYTFCRLIKDDVALRQIPVTFVSSQDTIEARLKGYDSGGEDFIVKPFQMEEVLCKVQIAQQIIKGKQLLARKLEDYKVSSRQAAANLDEYVILVNFLRDLVSWNSAHEIAAGLLGMLENYKLDGVVQTRVSGQTQTLSVRGTDLPLEVSVVNYVRDKGKGRVFESGSRNVYNFEHLTLMVNNMPLHDLECCSRLRYHHCIAAESAETRLRALEIEADNQRSQTGIHESQGRIRTMMAAMQERHLNDKVASSDLFLRLENSLTMSFANLGLSDDQERHMEDLINGFMNEQLALLDRGKEIHETLQELSERLGQLAPDAASANRSHP